MRYLPIRLHPNQDLRLALEALLAQEQVRAAFVVSGIGSLSTAMIRFAGMSDPTPLHGDFELLTLAGSLSPDGAHLHMTISDAQGQVTGGHAAPGCIIRTTAEILLALLPDHGFTREPDAASGCKELVIRPA
ncbi:DNA-binding protein [Massilia sp. G4R7]|uniref:DNA-binding protein n=1 Tax=Massilia phyllostachyos TaxID=2898585 RepID=A0ABS8Q9E7_9BURK|nr:PPC domain-containing DNA-binding protein [Massilia phyllostachyos]MCD2518163.1 DNA-binding protein [Massilia phyllostachyos]